MGHQESWQQSPSMAGVGRDPWVLLVPPLPKWGHLEQGTQHHVQVEDLQGGRLHDLSGQPVWGLCHQVEARDKPAVPPSLSTGGCPDLGTALQPRARPRDLLPAPFPTPGGCSRKCRHPEPLHREKKTQFCTSANWAWRHWLHFIIPATALQQRHASARMPSPPGELTQGTGPGGTTLLPLFRALLAL